MARAGAPSLFSMNHLLPCTGCERHVRAADPLCPFCGEALPMSLRQTSAPALPALRLGRAATFAFGASMAVTACGGTMGDTDAGPTPSDAGSASDSGGGATDAGVEEDAGSMMGDDAGMMMMTDAGDDPDAGADAGADTDAGTDAGADTDAGVDAGGITPLYGGVPLDGGIVPSDAGFDAGFDAGGGITPLYGGVPVDAGPSSRRDAAITRRDGGGIMPLYGGAPGT